MYKYTRKVRYEGMKTVKWYCNTGFANCKHEGIIEVEEDATEEEIEESVVEEVFNYIEWGWRAME